MALCSFEYIIDESSNVPVAKTNPTTLSTWGQTSYAALVFYMQSVYLTQTKESALNNRRSQNQCCKASHSSRQSS